MLILMPSPSTPTPQASAGTPEAVDWVTERRKFIEAGGNTTHSFGLGRMIGRLYALLYLTPEPMALEEIAEQLGISKASASTTVRQLAAWQAVRSSWVTGDRRDFYEAEIDFVRILRDGLLPGLRKKLASAGLQIKRTLAADAPPASSDGDPARPTAATPETPAPEIIDRLRRAQNLHQQIDLVLTSDLLEQVF